MTKIDKILNTFISYCKDYYPELENRDLFYTTFLFFSSHPSSSFLQPPWATASAPLSLSPFTPPPPCLPRSPRYKWQSKLRHYEVAWPAHEGHPRPAGATILARPTPPPSGEAPISGEKGATSPPTPLGCQLSSFMAAQEGQRNLLRRCPNWYSVLKRGKRRAGVDVYKL